MFVLAVPILEKILRPICVYIFLIVGLRLSGKRELVQLNPFDLVVLLTLSNTVQNAIIGEDNTVTGGIIGATSLLIVNYLVVRFLYKHRSLDQFVEGRSDVLIEDGKVKTQHLRKELITMAQLEAAARKQGFDSLSIKGRPTTVEGMTAGTLVVLVHALDVNEEASEGDDDASGADDDAGKPKELLVGEQCEGTDDECKFENAFSGIEVVGALLIEVALLFEILGFPADVLLVAAVAFDFFRILFTNFSGFVLVLGGNDTEEIRETLEFAQANIFGLVVGPLIAGLGLQQKFLRVGAMA